jgi:catechol 2,3-dioxygenase-like lactoylglutathione lyase family enzyme
VAIHIKLFSLMVVDQDKAEAFYTQKLGFVVKQNFPAGGARWLSVVAPGRDDLELSLEPATAEGGQPTAIAFQRAMFDQGIPMAAFEVDDLAAEHARLTELGVAFTSPPAEMGPIRAAILSDTVGNLLMLYQPIPAS